MTKRGAILLSVLTGLIAVPLFSFVIDKAYSQTDVAPAPRGPFGISASDQMVWRIDQASGRVSYCIRDTSSMDPKYIATRAPYCSAWSQ
jgi:hypothetical protein